MLKESKLSRFESILAQNNEIAIKSRDAGFARKLTIFLKIFLSSIDSSVFRISRGEGHLHHQNDFLQCWQYFRVEFLIGLCTLQECMFVNFIIRVWHFKCYGNIL
jgi:hypothetical protein